jgi:hypothetical protein
MSDKSHSVMLSREELIILTNALNDLLHGLDFSDDELHTRLGAKRPQIEKLMAKLQAALKK